MKIELPISGNDELLAALANLPDDAEVTLAFAMKVRRAREVLGRGQRGPDVLSTTQCANIIGGSARKWRDWAPYISGAKKDDAGDWRLPNDAAREHYARVLDGGQPLGHVNRRPDLHARGRRGPRGRGTLAAVRGGKRG